MPKHHTAADYVKVLTESHGLVAPAARKLKVTRQAVYRMAKKHPTVQEAMTDAREELIDLAEVRLFEAVNKGSLPAVFFALRTIGKDRGYGTRVEIDHKVPTQEEIEAMSDEELERHAKALRLN